MFSVCNCQLHAFNEVIRRPGTFTLLSHLAGETSLKEATCYEAKLAMPTVVMRDALNINYSFFRFLLKIGLKLFPKKSTGSW